MAMCGESHATMWRIWKLVGTVVLSAQVLHTVYLAAAPAKWVSGFYVGYMAEAYPPAQIDFSSLTHVLVFSVLPKPEGTLDTSLFIDPINGPKVAREVARRAHQAGKKAILTIGGTGTGKAFSSAMKPSTRDAFVGNILQIVSDWGFDGVDIDWEPMPREDYAAVMALISGIRARKAGMPVTIDVGWQNLNFRLEPPEQRFYRDVSNIVDQMNMMTYGMADNWDGWVAWHSSAVRGEGPDHPTSVQSSVAQYRAAGVPVSKLGIGIGFFGSCWSAPANGALQPPRQSRVVAGDNDMSFANIKNDYYRAINYHHDAATGASYLSFSIPVGPKKCTFISYEDEASVAAKGRYADESGVGGAMIWQLNEGYNRHASEPHSVLRAVARAFHVQ